MNSRLNNPQSSDTRKLERGGRRFALLEIERTADDAKEYCDLQARLALLRKDQEDYDAHAQAGNFLHAGLVKVRRLLGEEGAMA
jgi:hypothetical protein